MLPVFGADPITSLAELRALTAGRPSTRKVECMSFHPLGSARMGRDASEGAVAPSGETWSTRNLFVADGSVLPSSIGVNSQLPVMAMALRIARGINRDFPANDRVAA
jgi:choline dehydrogenase-like flavoprotein